MDLNVNRTIYPEDLMFAGNLDHYLSCGRSALRILRAAAKLANVPTPRTILDFGAGAGRVTRWLTASFHDSIVRACDIRANDVEFVASTLGIEAWVVGRWPDPTSVRGCYDLIWAGSVITHLPATDALQIIKSLTSCCTDQGLLVFSFHGRYVMERGEAGLYPYIHADGWQEIKAGYDRGGYGYANYRANSGYGVSVCAPEAVMEMIRSLPGVRLILLGERLWDNHHDVAVIQRLGG